MVMETNQEVLIGFSALKGKRTKRQRPVSPLGLPVTSSAGESGSVTGNSRIRTPATSIDDSSFSNNNNSIRGDEEEEEDMANCLMLLAQGSQEINRKLPPSGVYRCKTCNRSFPSFQALGGHRSSHKKPNNKLGKEENTSKPERLVEEFHHQNRYQFLENPMSTTLSLQISNNSNYTCKVNSNKIHECSVCGAEFSSGQALGGHMRRHRAVFSSSNTATAAALPATVAPSISLIRSSSGEDQPEFQELKKRRSSLQLDLNLPAESEEDNVVRESKFHLPSKEQVLVFSADSLVDCHY